MYGIVDFLGDWVAQHTDIEPLGTEEVTALAAELEHDACAAGFSEEELLNATGGDLVSYVTSIFVETSEDEDEE